MTTSFDECESRVASEDIHTKKTLIRGMWAGLVVLLVPVAQSVAQADSTGQGCPQAPIGVTQRLGGRSAAMRGPGAAFGRSPGAVDYERREAASKELLEFRGGHEVEVVYVSGFALFLVVLIVFLIILV